MDMKEQRYTQLCAKVDNLKKTNDVAHDTIFEKIDGLPVVKERVATILKLGWVVLGAVLAPMLVGVALMVFKLVLNGK